MNSNRLGSVALLTLSLLLQPVWASPEPAEPAMAEASQPADAESTAAAQELLLQAMGLLGVQYKWGGNDPQSGLDCSGFVRYVFQNAMNIALPHNALQMSQMGRDIARDDLKPGDLVFFNTLGRAFSHVGIYMGDGRFIHSPRAGKSVRVEEINLSYWKTRWNGARRVNSSSVNVAKLLASAGEPSAERATAKAAASKPKKKCKEVTKVVKGKKRKVEECR
ncbi:C40 family peptidase [Chitinibacteraceae bacterium HSL-7]